MGDNLHIVIQDMLPMISSFSFKDKYQWSLQSKDVIKRSLQSVGLNKMLPMSNTHRIHLYIIDCNMNRITKL